MGDTAGAGFKCIYGAYRLLSYIWYTRSSELYCGAFVDPFTRVSIFFRLSGLSPFMGDDDNETISNVCAGEWDFDTEDDFFDDVSQMAKNFITELLKMDPK